MALVPGRHWIAPMFAAAIILGFGALIGWAWQSPVLRVQEIVVHGSMRVSPEDIAEASALAGDHLLTADTAAAERAIAELPLVSSATVSRDWPHSVKITVEERQPWGVWEQSGVAYAIDHDGVVLGTTNLPGAESPHISSNEPGTRIVGERVDIQAVQATAEIYELLPTRIGTAVESVAFTAAKGIQVTTADKLVAIFGDASAIDYKLAVWASVAARAREEGISYTTIDLRFGNRPVVQ
jgi:cell division protein FtsQ